MKITVPLSEALETIRKNFEAHQEELKEALVGWNMEVHEALDGIAAAVDSKGLKADCHKVWALFQRKPVDNREEYARNIAALETAWNYGQQSIDMTVDEFDELMRDNFDWRRRSRESNAGYSAKSKGEILSGL